MRYIFLTLSIIVSVAAFIMVAQNNLAFDWNIFGTHIHTTELIPAIFYFVCGFLIPLSILGIRHQQNINSSKHLADWQKQDAKLASEINSDREKQLEAKIATLEAALKSALKKG
jgi:uncharacterized protein YlxW (UPF0749 family)